MIDYDDDMPNFFMVNDVQEDPEDIIESYYYSIIHSKDNPKIIKFLLEDFFEKVNKWTLEDMLIEQAKAAIYNLQMLNEEIDEDTIDDDDDEEF